MPICHKRKFIFLHIPRCGGTSIESHLKLIDKELLHGVVRINDEVVTLHHLTMKDAIRAGFLSAKTAQEHFKFTIIRNPLKRFILDYFWQWNHDPKQHFGHLTFDEFIDFAQDIIKGERYFEEKHFDHFRPMTAYCYEGEKLVVDDVLLLDSIQEGLARLESILGKVELPHLNSSRGNPSNEAHLKLTPDRIRRIEDLHAMDFELYETIRGRSNWTSRVAAKKQLLRQKRFT